jgi:negative regulator of flagellin synthesis FlgM
MQIGATNFSSTQSLGRTNRIDYAAPQTPRPASFHTTDQLDISPEAELLSRTLETKTDFRADKVAQMKSAIAEGNYDTDEKLDSAMMKMLDEYLS